MYPISFLPYHSATELGGKISRISIFPFFGAKPLSINFSLEISLEKPEIPEDFLIPLKKMLIHTLYAVKALAHATDSLFSVLRGVRQHVEEVGRQESEVDQVEYKLLKKIFQNEKFELARQYQLKGILRQLGAVTNLAEDVADAVLILSTKHST